jgi:hypothetical protein
MSQPGFKIHPLDSKIKVQEVADKFLSLIHTANTKPNPVTHSAHQKPKSKEWINYSDLTVKGGVWSSLRDDNGLEFYRRSKNLTQRSNNVNSDAGGVDVINIHREFAVLSLPSSIKLLFQILEEDIMSSSLTITANILPISYDLTKMKTINIVNKRDLIPSQVSSQCSYHCLFRNDVANPASDQVNGDPFAEFDKESDIILVIDIMLFPSPKSIVDIYGLMISY